jgi:hypothetical protein
MRYAFAVAASSLIVAAFCSSVAAQQLPKSGSVSVHSGYWAVGESVNVAEKTVQGHGNNRGITFNDKGSGPLHLGPTDCFYTFSTIADQTKVKGYCTFGDTDGDRIFTEPRRRERWLLEHRQKEFHHDILEQMGRDVSTSTHRINSAVCAVVRCGVQRGVARCVRSSREVDRRKRCAP